MRLTRFSLTMALGLTLPLQPMAAWASTVEPAATSQPATYRELRPQLLAALRECTHPKPLALCEPANQRLQDLIVDATHGDYPLGEWKIPILF